MYDGMVAKYKNHKRKKLILSKLQKFNMKAMLGYS